MDYRKKGSRVGRRIIGIILTMMLVFGTALPQGALALAWEEQPASEAVAQDTADSALEDGAVPAQESEQADAEAATQSESEQEVPDETEAATEKEAMTQEAPEDVVEDAADEVIVIEEAPAISVFAEEGVSYRDGEYEGTGRGYSSDIVVKVVIANGAIDSIQVVSQSETNIYWSSAVKAIDQILEAQGTDIDGVSGATASVEGIRRAVNNALEKAKKSDNPVFESGDGSQGSPYVIKTAEQLIAFAASVDEGTTYEGLHIVLGGDIALASDQNWDPIGTQDRGSSNLDKIFNGHFDGQGYIISGMTMKNAYEAESNIGLFSTLNTKAVVENVKLRDVNIDVSTTGATVRAGGIAGDTITRSEGVIDHCSVTGSIKVTSESDPMIFVGGILGRAMVNAAIANSWTDVKVEGVSPGAGFPSAYCGGIVGMTGNGVALVNLATFGDETSNTASGSTMVGYAGGIGGMIAGSNVVLNVHAQGDASLTTGESGHSWVGALAGMMTNGDGARADAYYATDAKLTKVTAGTSSVIETKPAGSSTQNTNFNAFSEAVAKTSAEMKEEAFRDLLNTNGKDVKKTLEEKGLSERITLKSWILEDARVIPGDEDWYATEIDSGIFDSGSGTAEDPYVIMTEKQLRDFAASLTEAIDYADTHIILGADIDVSSAEFRPVGGSDYAFNGTFDGKDHKITGFYIGKPDAPTSLDADNQFIGLFGVLGKNSRVKNVTMDGIYINTVSEKTVRIGGIVGYMEGSSEGYLGAVIDNCHVTGEITHVQDDGNTFVGGIAAYQYKGAIINSSTDISCSATTKGSALGECGGLVALNNRGLVANCYTLGDVYGSGNRDGDNEGMATISPLVAVNAGLLVGCYGDGDSTSKEISSYTGAVSGWITGVGKSYSSHYNGDAAMTINGKSISPVAAVGTCVPGGVSEDGLVYTGGLSDDLHAYNATSYAKLHETLNAKFKEYPADLTQYGLAKDALKTWVYENELVTFGNETAETTYVQPEAELVPAPEEKLQDGVWYGRDPEKKTVVKITVENSEITKEEVLVGTAQDPTYAAALERAKEKSTWGDISHYFEKDPSKFAGGSGTEQDPYQIANEEQLRYLAWSINEDENWAGSYFIQTADIDVSSDEWLPIGWALEATVNNAAQTVAAYPFSGNYDGGDHTTSGVKIGSADAPKDAMTVGMFGFTYGEYVTNNEPTDELSVTIKNVHLTGVDIHTATKYQNYVGGLLGLGQYGIFIDNCSVEGAVDGRTSDSHCRVGGLAGSTMRGAVTNAWTNVKVNAVTDLGRVYSAGLAAMTNRTTVVNVYTLGDVTGEAPQPGRQFLGGLVGQDGGVLINAYSRGNVEAKKADAANYLGLIDGLIGGIAVDLKTYFNKDAKMVSVGTELEAKSIGFNASGSTDDSTGVAKSEIGAQSFADTMNENREKIADLLKLAKADLEGGSHILYFNGTAEDLKQWGVKDGIVCFVEEAEEVPVYRLYNKKTGEHLFTSDEVEKQVLYEKYGWGYEGTAWFAPKDGVGVYRLFNPKTGQHLYTSDTVEVDVLTSKYGWVKDFNGEPLFYSGGPVEIYRVFNPKNVIGSHHWTTDATEYSVLPRYNWKQEGVKMNALRVGEAIKTEYYKK